MTAPTQPVTIKLADFGGPSVAGVKVTARLSDVDWMDDGTIVSTNPVQGVTDVNGQVVLQLFPNATVANGGLGTMGTTVRVIAQIPHSHALDVQAAIPNMPCNLVDYIVSNEPLGLSGSEGAASSALASRNLARDWASKTDGEVDNTDFSAKEFAQGTQGGTGGSAKNWSQQTGADVTGAAAGSRSSKSWAQEDLTPAGQNKGGSAKDWATSGNLPDGVNKSAKSYAADAAGSAGAAAGSAGAAAGSAGAAAGSAGAASGSAGAAATSATLAQDWATKTAGEVVAGQGYGAKKYANDASASAAAAAGSADQATNASATTGAYSNGASANVPRGLTQASVGAITPGAGGTNGTFALSWSSGNFSINPTGTFTVAGGQVTAVTITGPGLYIGAAPTPPTPSFAASAGLAGAAVALTAQFLIAAGQGYWAQSADGKYLDRYKNVGGVATSDTANVQSIPVAGSLNDTAAVAIQVFQKVTDATRNLFDPSTITNLQALVRATGLLTAAGAQFTTDFIPVVPSGKFVANADMSGDGTFGGYVFYDRTQALIPGSGGAPVVANTAVNVPTGAVWMRCSFPTSTVQGSLMIVSGNALPAKYKTHVFQDQLAVREATHAQIAEDHGILNLFNRDNITDNNYLSANNNTLNANVNYYITNYIPVVQGGTITFNGTSSLGAPYGVAWYDISGNHILGAAGTGTPPVANTPIAVPFGAAYCRCTFDKAGNPASDLVAVQGSVLPPYYVPYGVSTAVVQHLRHWAGAGIMFLGDSITANYPGAKQWPKWLCGRLNANFVANNGVAGRVMKDLTKDTGGVDLVAAAFDNVDLTICMAGTNDFNAARVGGTGALIGTIADAQSYGANSFHANTKYVIERLYGLKPTMRVVFMTPTFRSAASGLAATTPSAEGKTLYDYADAVKNCCALYGVPTLDLLRTGGMNTFNSGTYLSDGLHPTPTDGGVTIIGKPMSAFLSSIR